MTMFKDRMNHLTPQACWAEYERQLFASAIGDASRYERALKTIRAMADRLGEFDSVERLVAAWPESARMMLDMAPSETSLPAEQLLGAAFAIREREIVGQNARDARRSAIKEAQGAGHTWVTLEQSGAWSTASVAPYRKMEMHVTTGLAIVAMVQQDPSDGATLFVTTTVKLDPRSGELEDAEPSLPEGLGDWREHKAVEDHLAFLEFVRERIGDMDGKCDPGPIEQTSP